MARSYIDTPRTEIDANATYMTNGLRSAARHNLSALDSVENSFQSPSGDHNLVKAFDTGKKRKSADFNLRTPKAGAAPRPARNALHDRQNLPTAAPPKGEFTPLLNSVTRNNFLRTRGGNRGRGGPETPAVLRDGYRSSDNTPGLPQTDITGMYDDESMDAEYQKTPLPVAASSSVHSTPTAVLPGQDGNNVVVGDGRKVLTLREQESAVDKLNKENFSLKLKIHFLEQTLGKMGPDVNKIALQENAQLKASEISMQRELKRCQRNLQDAERNLEGCQVEITELREKARRRQSDEDVQKDLDSLRAELEDREDQLHDLQEELDSVKESESDQIQQLRDEIEDLKFELRQKDQLIDEKDEQIESLKENEENNENEHVAELEGQLEEAKDKIEELQDNLEHAQSEAQEARAEADEAAEKRDHAIEDLRELQEEMANKSFSTKGLSRQLEEKASTLEDELNRLRKEHATLKDTFDDNSRETDKLHEQLQELQSDLDEVRNERDIANRERGDVASRLQQFEDEVWRRQNEKDVLQNRHDALTNESSSLLRDLESAKGRIAELEEQVNEERQQSVDTIRQIRSKHKNEIESTEDKLQALKYELEDKSSQYAAAQERWESAKRTLEMQRDKLENEAAGYKRSIDKLHDAERNLNGQESKLKDVLESEKQRHLEEKEFSDRQIKELNDDLASKRRDCESQRQEVLNLKEELRLSKREEASLKDKVLGLEDEVVILQASLEEEQQRVSEQQRIGSSGLDRQLQTSSRERQAARDQLANANISLHNVQTLCAEIEAERDELRSQLDDIRNQVDGTYRLDQDKLELRKAKQRLESEVNRLRDEKKSILETKDVLQVNLDTEIERAAAEENRLSAEIHQLQDKLFMMSEKKDRELTSAKNKAQRFEIRVHELESLLEQQALPDQDAPATSPGLSILRRNLEDARQKEKAGLQREAGLKSSIRELKDRIIDLEREIHELKTKELDATPPNSSPSSSKFQEELRSLRGQLLDAHKTMRELRTQNHDLKRAEVKEDERKDLHELLKSSTLEAESLAVKLTERDTRVNELKTHLRRVREERNLFMRKADAAGRELDTLQRRYETVIDELSNHSERGGRHAKELRGLGKEIMWLRARLAREEQFRKGLSWSKGLMELAERVRVACNETDLKMIAEMGIQPPVTKPVFNPRRKLRGAVIMVISICRMKRLSLEWSKARKLHEGLRKAKGDVIKKRESARRAEELGR